MLFAVRQNLFAERRIWRDFLSLYKKKKNIYKIIFKKKYKYIIQKIDKYFPEILKKKTKSIVSDVVES